MFVATLIFAPGGAGPADALASDAARLFGAAVRPDWLGEGLACDLLLPAEPPPEPLRALRELALEGRFDCVVQQRAGRRKRFLIADMDSTMIEQECVDELAAEIGIKDQVAGITARAMNGEIAFEPALRERVALLKDLAASTIDHVLQGRITLARGGRELVATMRAGGGRTALVSGGFTAFTGPVAEKLGFDEHHANRLLVENGRLTGHVVEPILGSAAKVAALREITAAIGVGVGEAIAVGDGANDLEMIRLAGTGIALHAKPTVAAAAPHRVDHGDLTALLYVQGYRQAEFVL